MISLINRITRIFGVYVTVEWEIQATDHQGCYTLWSNGFADKGHAMQVLENYRKQEWTSRKFRVQKTIEITKYYGL